MCGSSRPLFQVDGAPQPPDLPPPTPLQGGDSWRNISHFMAAVLGVESPQASAERIVAAAAPAAARGDAIVLLAHNGPAGLGAQRHDICGVDWK